MPLWIPITIAAAFLQNVRSLLQKNLTGRLSVGGATFARFVFAFPLALTYALAVTMATGSEVPPANWPFLGFLILGAVAQILATYALLASFQHGSFAVGNSYASTEALQAAVLASILLAEWLSLLGLVAVLLGFAGVVLTRLGHVDASRAAEAVRFGPAVWWGVAAGTLFAFASVGYRGASLSLGVDSVFVSAGWSLAAATLLQTVLMAVYLSWREPGTVTATLKQWRQSGLIALVGVSASIGWFTALTLQTAALVKALAQIELAFSTLTSWLYFKEPISASELVGIVLIGLSVVMIVLVA
ncbi:MAG: DMT family transporter [Pseudomonadota bacterium]